jgi:hypothetical protein
MHECPDCFCVCCCTGDDLWNDLESDDCQCECYDEDDDWDGDEE